MSNQIATRDRIPGPAEDQAQAMVSMPKGLALIKVERETMTALAAAHPRDMEQIKDDLSEILEAFPILAEESIYNKPVGKEDGGGQQKYARNLSIRAAEVLAEAYGYNETSADLEIIDQDHIKIIATFIDYQRGRITREPAIVSKFYKQSARYGGKMVRIPDDRFYNVTLKAEKSKAVREAILRCVNAGLRMWFFDQCEKIVDTILDDKTVAKIVGQFSTKGVSQEQLERHIGKALSAGWTKQDRKDLLGIWNSIKDEESSIDEVFGQVEQKKPLAASQAPVNGGQAPGTQTSDLSNPKKSSTQTPPSESPPASHSQAGAHGGTQTAPPPANTGIHPPPVAGSAILTGNDGGASLPSSPLPSVAPAQAGPDSPSSSGAGAAHSRIQKQPRRENIRLEQIRAIKDFFQARQWSGDEQSKVLADYGAIDTSSLSYSQAEQLLKRLRAN